MKNYRNLTTAVIISTVFLILYNISAFAFQCGEIRSDVIRLHVIANSDSDEDQELKLKVRDAVLASGQEIFDGTVTPEDAEKRITPKTDELRETAENIIKESGYNYDVSVKLVNEYFDTRIYNDEVTLPAGKYLALKIVIGEGKGKNWWCVMFPSLCLPAAERTNNKALDSVFSDNEKNIVMKTPKYELRFKIIEYIEKLKNCI